MEKFERIMVVDDSPIDIFIAERTLLLQDFCDQVIYAFNGIQALEELKKYYSTNRSLPELIIVDLHMPKMSGLEFISKLMEEDYYAKESTKIVILTVDLEANLSVDALEGLDFSGVLTKPLEIDGLVKLLDQ